MIKTKEDAEDFINDFIYGAERPLDFQFLEKLEQAKFIYDEKFSKEDKSYWNNRCFKNNGSDLEDYFDQFFDFLSYEDTRAYRNFYSRILKEFKINLRLKLEEFLEGETELSLEQIEAYKLLYQIYKDNPSIITEGMF